MILRLIVESSHFPQFTLDKWTKECIEDYSSKIAEKTPDPEFHSRVE